MMYVGIDHGDPLVGVFARKILHHYGHVVDIAEAPVAWTTRMLWWPWGPDQGKAVLDLSFSSASARVRVLPAAMRWASVTWLSTSGTQKWTRATSFLSARRGLYSSIWAGPSDPPRRSGPECRAAAPPLRMGGGYGPVEGGEEYEARLAFLFSAISSPPPCGQKPGQYLQSQVKKPAHSRPASNHIEHLAVSHLGLAGILAYAQAGCPLG